MATKKAPAKQPKAVGGWADGKGSRGEDLLAAIRKRADEAEKGKKAPAKKK